MRFFDRTKEIQLLKGINQVASNRAAQFTVLTGRRRIGKTLLVLNALGLENIVYLFVARKAEADLCQDFAAEIADKLAVPLMAAPSSFKQVFDFLMQLSCQRPLTLFIDEFQEFLKINKSIYWDMQRTWDLYKDKARINLIVCGSVNSLMHYLFRDVKQPLYGRQTQFIKLEGFAPSVLKDILAEYNPSHTSDDLLALYALTGGVAKYVQQFIDMGITSAASMLEYTVRPNSYFLDEGKAMLVEEFGRDYATYFSVLSLIAQGHNTRADVENILKTEIGGYLTRLETEYGLIAKHRPLLEKSAAKNLRYYLNDNFLIFWFRFIYKYGYMLEAGANAKLLTMIQRDYPTFSGRALERYFTARFIEQGAYTRLGGWWNRKGEQEIDIIGIDELAHAIDFYEVKRQRKELNMAALEAKASAFITAHGELSNYAMRCQGLTLRDM